MQHNEPGFGVALEQMRRTPDDHNAVGRAFARVTGGSPVWASVGIQLAREPRKAAELVGFTNEAAATHEDDPEALDMFNHFQREISDSMNAYVQSGGKDADALHHVADQMNDVFVHHLSAPLLGKAAGATHMTDEELADYRTGIEASAFATPEMVGAWYNPFSKKKSDGSAASSSSSSTSAKEKKPNVLTRAWRGAKKRVGGIVASGKKKMQQKADASAQARAQKIIQAMEVDSKLDILKNSRGNSASQVYAVAGQIRSLTGAASGAASENMVNLFGRVAPWRLPSETGLEGLVEFGKGFTSMWAIGVEKDFGEESKKESTWTTRDGDISPVDYLGFGSAGRLGHPKAQLFVWAYGNAAPKFTWNSSVPISARASFFQETDAFGSVQRYDFAAVTQANSNFSFLGSTTRSKFVRGDIGEMEGYSTFENDLDEYNAVSVKVKGRSDPVTMLDGKESPAYVMWKEGSLFVIDLVQNLLQRSAALTPRCRFYCKLSKVPSSWSSTTAIEVQIVAVTLEIQVQSIALGHSVVQYYKKNFSARQEAKKRGATAAASTVVGGENEEDTGVVEGK